jgi:para-nitrobenzyl esterase
MTVETIVRSSSGLCLGRRDQGVLRFAGIRYGRSPTGSRRWQPPEPIVDGKISTDEFVSAPQFRSDDKFDKTFPIRGVIDEDCLALNVWTGDLSGSRPVAAWIHGGGFAHGSGSEPDCDGAALARNGIVVVTINYRLGILGSRGSNLGLLDQLCALRWIAVNIAAFGGDAERVTVLGNSAGAMSAACLMASPDSEGLFQRAVLQSGAADVGLSLDSAYGINAAFELEALEMPSASSARLDSIIAAQQRVQDLVSSNSGLIQETHGLAMAFQPTIGYRPVLDRPEWAFQGGGAPGVPMIVGTTRDEWRLFSRLAGAQQATERDVSERIAATAAAAGVDPAALKVRYDGETPQDHWDRLQGERFFRLPAIRLAEMLSNAGRAVWVYRFDWSPDGTEGGLGACHGIDIPFVFGTFGCATADTLCPGAATSAAAEQIFGNWVNFISGRPPSSASDWPPYSVRQRWVRIYGNDGISLVLDPDEVVRRRWEKQK